jgi:hypothetical protein
MIDIFNPLSSFEKVRHDPDTLLTLLFGHQKGSLIKGTRKKYDEM